MTTQFTIEDRLILKRYFHNPELELFPYRVRESTTAPCADVQHFASPDEAITYARRRARENHATYYIRCDDREWLEFRGGRAIIKRPWHLFYEGPPTAEYNKLMQAAGGYR